LLRGAFVALYALKTLEVVRGRRADWPPTRPLLCKRPSIYSPYPPSGRKQTRQMTAGIPKNNKERSEIFTPRAVGWDCQTAILSGATRHRGGEPVWGHGPAPPQTNNVTTRSNFLGVLPGLYPRSDNWQIDSFRGGAKKGDRSWPLPEGRWGS